MKWKDLILVAVMTAIAWGISFFVIYDISSLPLFSGGSVPDVEISDLYNAVGNRASTSMKAKNTTIVSIDGCSRREIADAIEMISSMEPSALGLDVFFMIEDADGDAIRDALMDIPSLVLPIDIHHPESVSYFHDSIPGAKTGYVNIISTNATGMVRDYSVSQDGFPSFPYALAGEPPIASFNIIRFDGKQIPVIRASELSMKDEPDIRNHIVILGGLDDPSDMYNTPLGHHTPGVIIHALVTEMISTGEFIRRSPPWVETALALGLCFVFLFFMLLAKRYYDDAGTFFMRIVQLILIFVLFVLGCRMYIAKGLYLNLSFSITMLALGSLVFDIVAGAWVLFAKDKKL